MRKYFEKPMFLVLFLLAFAGPLQAQTGVIMERWEGATISDAQDLANNPALLGPPTSTTVLGDFFQAPMNQPGVFVTRFMAHLTPPVAGTYNWWITGDQKAKLWYRLGACTTTGFINKQPNATSITPVAPATTWDRDGQKATQIMNPIQTWCIMVIQVENNGDGVNHMALGWRRPGTAAEGYVSQYERPVPASRFTATGFPPVVPPMNITFDCTPATILTPGQQTTCNWTVANATLCTGISSPAGSVWEGPKTLSGLLALNPFFTTRYDLRCTPTDGTPPQTVSRTVTNTVYQQFTIAWDEVTTRTDGSPLTNRGGYRVYILTSSGSDVPSRIIDVGDVTSAIINNSYFPTTGTYYMKVVCYDATGLTSGLSNEVNTFVWVPGT